MLRKSASAAIALTLVTAWSVIAEEGAPKTTVESKYPRLSSGPLRKAVLADLPTGLVLRVEEIKITTKDLAAELAREPKELQGQVSKYPFRALDSMIVDKLVLKDAFVWASINGESAASERQLLQKYLQSIVAGVAASDAEIRKYYEDNRQLFSGYSFEKSKDSIKVLLEDEKRIKAAGQFINSISERHYIEVSGTWAAQQYVKWVKNPVEKIAHAGKPAVVNFYGTSCVACQLLAPVLEKLGKEYDGKIAFLPVNVDKEQIITMHYGIRPIPAQLFFDKEGKEVFRHEGYWDKAAFEAKFRELGFK